jgi:hypothetical protein
MTTERKERKTGKGRFAKGASGNPAGRPPGSRNKLTLLMEALLESQAEQLTQKVIDLGLAGDIHALRLCLDRIFPAPRDRPIHLRLPPIENGEQLSSAVSAVVEAIGDGSITPGEGETLARTLEVQNNVLTTGDLERRVEQLEQALLTHQNDEGDQEDADLAERLRAGRFPPEEVGHDQS